MENKEQTILQRHLSQFLIEDTFNTITEKDFLKILAPNIWEHKGNRLTEGQVNALRNEADIFKNSALWNILRSELLWKAKEGYSKSKGESDLIAVKILEYLVSLIDGKLESMVTI